jgi:quercetin 2,3-dioxygenase
MSKSKKVETILGRLLALLERDGDGVIVQAQEDAELLVVRGQPVDGPVVAYGPAVMNRSQEIETALADVWNGRFSQPG